MQRDSALHCKLSSLFYFADEQKYKKGKREKGRERREGCCLLDCPEAAKSALLNKQEIQITISIAQLLKNISAVSSTPEYKNSYNLEMGRIYYIIQ